VKSIKTGFVVVVMLAVAYGVWVMLNKKPVAGQLTLGDIQWSPPNFGPQPNQPAPPDGGYAPPKIEDGTAPLPPSQPPAAPDVPSVVSPQPYGPSSPAGTPASPQTGGAPVYTPEEYQRNKAAPPAVESSGSIYSAGNRPPLAPEPQGSASSHYDEPAETPSGTSADNAASSSGASAFMSAWRGAQDQLAQGELADALFTLSLWYESPDVPADMRPQLVELLDQLAGHVIYSPEHLLEPPHEVRAGETLADIAAQYDVPWQLLANINGISDPAQLEEGTSLKVVRGPFSAAINLERHELMLSVGRRYAGRFAIGMGNDPAPMTGDYIVREKEEQRTFYDREGRAIEPGAPENPYGPFWIGLGGRLAIHGAPTVEGQRESTGSIIVSAEDAADLFAILSKDSPVKIR
jgi:LysM repeat protein